MKTKISSRFSLISFRCMVHLLLVAVATPTFATVGSAPYNPPEFYDRIRALRKSILEKQRKTIDLTTHPKFRAVVTNTENLLRVDRLPSWFEVNRQNGVVDKVGLLDVVCDKQCAFGDLEITDKDGVVYRQGAVKTGDIKVKEENTYLYWTTMFSPAAENGKKLPLTIEAKYKLYKMGGLVTVHYKVLDGSAEIKQLVIRNSPGKLPVNLNIAHSAFFKDNEGKFNDTRSLEVPDLKPRVIMTGKVVAPFWTDGRIGFEGVAIRETWSQMGPFDKNLEQKRTVVATRNEQRCVDFYFVNTSKPVAMEKGRRMSAGFAFLPFQRFQPRLPLVNATVDLGVQFEYLKDGNNKAELVKELRRNFWTGAIFTGTGLASAGWTPLMYAVTKEPYRQRTQEILDLGRECEQVLGTAACVVNNFPGLPGDKGHAGPEEVNAALPEMLEALEKEGFCSLSTPEYCDFMLDVRTSTLEVFNVDADYEDLHAHIDVGKNFDSQVEGHLQYLEDINLLHEHFGGGKLIIAHAGNIMTVADGLNGATWAGEPWTGQSFRELPLAVLDSVMNPFIIGADAGVYGTNNTINHDSLKMNKQILRNAAVPMYANICKDAAGSMLRNPIKVKSEASERAWKRYFIPGRTFRTDKAAFVSWRDPAAADFFKTEKPDNQINLYYRENEAYATCVNLDDDPVKPKISFNVANLGFKGSETFVFNILSNNLAVVPVNNGWIEYSPEEATNEPVLLYLKDKLNDEPQIIWANYPLRFEKIEEETDASSAAWTCDIKVYPLERTQEVVRVYVGKLGRPRSYISWGVAYIKDFYPEQKSMDIYIEVKPATEGGPIGGPCESGPDGIGGKMAFKWNKTFQLSFPYLGEE